MSPKSSDTRSLLQDTKGRLDAIIRQLAAPGEVRLWRFWQGPPGAISPQEALHGDIASWQEVGTPHRWSTAAGDVWFRSAVTYPQDVEGIPTQGSPLELATTFLVYSRVYVNGQLAAGHDWWLDARTAPIPLTAAYEPGNPIEIACYVPQGDGLGHYGGAVVHCQRVEEAIRELALLRAQLTFSGFLAQRSGDLSRLAAWHEAVEGLPWAALKGRDWDAWRAGVAEGVARLAELTPEAKEYRVHAAAHAHIDMNWLWPWEDTVDVIRRDFATMDQLMARYPEFRFSQSQASTYWAAQVYDPDLLARVAERVRQGRWEVTANTWVENDLNMSCAEAQAHHFLYTRRYMRQLFGLAPRLIWEPDTFGHPATMPQIARKGGAEYYYFCRGGKRYPLFWWEAPDGSRLLGFQDLHWYNGVIEPQVVADSAAELAEQYGLHDSLLVYGVGDHGGGGTIRDLEEARRINAAPCLPRVELDSVTSFFDLVKASGVELPVVRGELNPVFAGCYTSHADVKRLNRLGETALLDAETTATVAALTAGYTYPRAALETSWQAVLFQQFHDILCGCGIGLTSKTAHAWAEPAIARAWGITNGALDAIVSRLETGTPPCLVVFNTLPWTRSGVVQAAVDWNCAWVQDDRSIRLPAQRAGEELIFVAQDVPALGCRVYYPGDATPLPDDGESVRSPWLLTLENARLRVEVHGQSGAIFRLLDTEAKRDLTHHAHGDPGAELVTAGVLNRLQVWWEQPHGMSAWKLGDISRVDHLVDGAQVRVVESGPVRGVVEVQRQFLHSSLRQRIMLYRGLRRIDFQTEVEWHEKGSETADAPMLRVRFEPHLGPTKATFQIPFGAIQRPADGQEVVAQMWADLSEEDGAYGVALLNDCKYGYQAHGNTLGLTLLRASYEPDQNPDEGLHRFTYAFYPHPGSWREAGVERRAQELNRPLLTRLVRTTPATRGAIQPGSAALHCAPEGVAVTGFKLAEEGEGVIVRLLEMNGEATTAELRLPLPIAEAEEVSLAEEPLEQGGEGLLIRDGSVQVALKPHEIRTLRLRV